MWKSRTIICTEKIGDRETDRQVRERELGGKIGEEWPYNASTWDQVGRHDRKTKATKIKDRNVGTSQG